MRREVVAACRGSSGQAANCSVWSLRIRDVTVAQVAWHSQQACVCAIRPLWHSHIQRGWPAPGPAARLQRCYWSVWSWHRYNSTRRAAYLCQNTGTLLISSLSSQFCCIKPRTHAPETGARNSTPVFRTDCIWHEKNWRRFMTSKLIMADDWLMELTVDDVWQIADAGYQELQRLARNIRRGNLELGAEDNDE